MPKNSASILDFVGTHDIKNILVLDDQEVMCSILSEVAKNSLENVETISFTEPNQAFNHVLKAKPNLIITDYKMEGMNGTQFVNKIRQHFNMEQLPIIMVTVIDDETRYAPGINVFISKPIKPNDLKFLISKFLSGQQGMGLTQEHT